MLPVCWFIYLYICCHLCAQFYCCCFYVQFLCPTFMSPCLSVCLSVTFHISLSVYHNEMYNEQFRWNVTPVRMLPVCWFICELFIGRWLHSQYCISALYVRIMTAICCDILAVYLQDC